MVIALDYDETFTKDPELWKLFIALAKKRGHVFVCVTGRHPTESVSIGDGIMTIYAPSQYKRLVATEFGVEVDVWIDDLPGFIEPSRVLEGF